MSNSPRPMVTLAPRLAAGVLLAMSMTGWTFAQPTSNPEPAAAETQVGTGPSAPRPGSRVPQPGSQPLQHAQTRNPVIIDLDFPGGTIAEYIAAVHEATGTPINIITSPDVAAMRLGPVRLRSASGNIVVEAVLTALVDRDDRSELKIQHLSGAGSESYGIVVNRFPAMAMPASAFSQDARTDLVGTYSIAALVNAPADDPEAKVLPREDVTKAIEAVLKLVAPSKPPKIFIHPETSLLVVQGSSSHLGLAETVITQLKEDLAATRQTERAVRNREQSEKRLRAARVEHQQTLEAEIHRSEQAAQPLRTRLAQLRAAPKVGEPAVQEQIAAVEAQLGRINHDRQQLEQQLRMQRLGLAPGGNEISVLRNELLMLRQEFEALKSQGRLAK